MSTNELLEQLLGSAPSGKSTNELLEQLLATDFTGPAGAAGADGAQGPQGPQGIQGPAGTTNASEITAGTLADARLSDNVALRNAANTFTATPLNLEMNTNGLVAIRALNNNNSGTAAIAQLRAELTGGVAIAVGAFSSGITGSLADYANRGAIECGTSDGISFTAANAGATFDIRTGGRANANRRMLVTAAGAVLIGRTSGLAGSGDLDVAGNCNIDKFLQMAEMTAPAAGAANTARLFTRDNGSGKTQLCVIFNTGAIVVIATQP